MTSQQNSQHFGARNALEVIDFDPDGTSATDVKWVDMRDFGGIHATFMRTIGTSAFTFQLVANDLAAGAGTDVIVKSHLVGSEPDALEDQIHLECTAEEIRHVGEVAGVATRFITARASFATGTDEGVFVYARYAPSWAEADLTADVVA